MNKTYFLILLLLFSCSKKLEGLLKFRDEVKSEVFDNSLIQKGCDLEGKMATIRTANNLENRDLATIVIRIDKEINEDYDNYLERINYSNKYSISYDTINEENEVISNEVLSFIKFEGEVIPIPSLNRLGEKHLYLEPYFDYSNPRVYITDYKYGYFFLDTKYKNLVKEMRFYKDHGYTSGAVVDEELGLITLFLMIW